MRPDVPPVPQRSTLRLRAIEDFVGFALDRADIRFSRADRLADIVVGNPDGLEKSSA